MTYDFDDIIMYLDDIDSYVNSILYYHYCTDEDREKLDIKEILMYLSSISEIIQDIKDFLDNSYFSKE